ncbi:MAG: hypothetical protein Aurels2KO_02120 [Aureliella sp.]
MKDDSLRTIFVEALDRPHGEERNAYLHQACGGDAELRSAVDDLLQAHEMPDNPLDALPPGLSAPSDSKTQTDFADSQDPAASDVGRTIGPYKLMELIGEGGFGLVYVAQQSSPVKRRVALKILRPGMGTKEVLARFEAERQAVAMMDHPNIAKIFDAGVTDSDARPYFVMELVRGLPLTQYCDTNSMAIPQRLQLFEDVCAATHHAHQKGIIHRDLKPSNVLVSEHGDKAVIKVIDFGVAKALETGLTDQTVYTRFYSMIGTPLYMSPEQAAMSGLDVDTRSDIYSLGVMLYELLTGTTPFDRDRLDSAGYDEMRRIIREEEPPKPSARLTTVRESFSTIDSARRSSLPSVVASGPLPSDLDWIVMRALEKDRDRRYDSAAAMAADIRRFTNHEPIEARPPSKLYQMNKLLRRKKTSVITASLVAAAICIGMGATIYQALEAIDEKEKKEAALKEAIAAKKEVEGFAERLKTANSLVEQAHQLESADDFARAENVYTEAVNLVPNYYLVWLQRANVRAQLHDWQLAAADFAAASRLDAPYDSRQWMGASTILALSGQRDALQAVYQTLDKRLDATNGSVDWSTVRSSLVTPRPPEIANRCVDVTRQLLAGEPGRPGGFFEQFGPPPRPGEGYYPPGDWPNGGPGEQRRGERDGGRWEDGPPRSGRPSDGPRGDGPRLDGPRGDGPRGDGPPGNRQGRGRRERLPFGVQHYITAWAHLRADNSQPALDHISLAQNDRGWPASALTFPLAAMAHNRLGDRDAALKALAEAEAAAQRLRTNDGELRSTESVEQMPWFDAAELLLLTREANAEVLGDQ